MSKMGLEDSTEEEYRRLIVDCYYCKQPTMFEVYHNKKQDWSMYECLSCDKSYLKDWSDENERIQRDTR